MRWAKLHTRRARHPAFPLQSSPDWVRTSNRSLRRRLLFQLSYGAIRAGDCPPIGRSIILASGMGRKRCGDKFIGVGDGGFVRVAPMTSLPNRPEARPPATTFQQWLAQGDTLYQSALQDCHALEAQLE